MAMFHFSPTNKFNNIHILEREQKPFIPYKLIYKQWAVKLTEEREKKNTERVRRIYIPYLATFASQP